MGTSGLGRNSKKGGNASQELLLQLVIGKIKSAIESANNILKDIYNSMSSKEPEEKKLYTVTVTGDGAEHTIEKSYNGSIYNNGEVNITFGEISIEPGMSILWGNDGTNDWYTDLKYTVPVDGSALIIYTGDK